MTSKLRWLSVTPIAFRRKSKLLGLAYKALSHAALAELLSHDSLMHTPSCGLLLPGHLLPVFSEHDTSSCSGPTYPSLALPSRVMSSSNPVPHPSLGCLLLLCVSVALSSHQWDKLHTVNLQNHNSFPSITPRSTKVEAVALILSSLEGALFLALNSRFIKIWMKRKGYLAFKLRMTSHWSSLSKEQWNSVKVRFHIFL